MLTTIEQKLSAIKAINSSREHLELKKKSLLMLCVTAPNSSDKFVNLMKNSLWASTLTQDELVYIKEKLQEYYDKEDEKLKAQAQELMK